MKNCSKRVIPLRHVVFTIQVISLIFSVFHRAMPQPVAVVTYCLGVFTAPYLMLSYGCRYLSSAKWWSWECIPFVLETAFSVLYAGASIYGIRYHSNETLFVGLLTAFLVDALLCTLGYIGYLVEENTYEKTRPGAICDRVSAPHHGNSI